jgi:hypothetical protein
MSKQQRTHPGHHNQGPTRSRWLCCHSPPRPHQMHTYVSGGELRPFADHHLTMVTLSFLQYVGPTMHAQNKAPQQAKLGALSTILAFTGSLQLVQPRNRTCCSPASRQDSSVHQLPHPSLSVPGIQGSHVYGRCDPQRSVASTQPPMRRHCPCLAAPTARLRGSWAPPHVANRPLGAGSQLVGPGPCLFANPAANHYDMKWRSVPILQAHTLDSCTQSGMRCGW